MQVSVVGEQQGATRDSARRSRGGVIRGGEWGQGLTRGVDSGLAHNIIPDRVEATLHPPLLHACFLNLL